MTYEYPAEVVLARAAENRAMAAENERLRATLLAVNACLVDQGGYPRFAVRQGADFDAACQLVRAAIADFR